jgi:Kinetochore complex Sim4 subunit Fta1
MSYRYQYSNTFANVDNATQKRLYYNTLRSENTSFALDSFSNLQRPTMEWFHTWSIHGVMLTETDSAVPQSNTLSQLKPTTVVPGIKRSLRLHKNLSVASLEQLEFDATDHLRRCRSQAQTQKEKRARSSVSKEVHHEGDFVRIMWIDNQSGKSDDVVLYKHLYVEVRIEEVLSAVVIFCYYNQNSDDGIPSDFEFCLARGLRSSYETIFGWIATITDGLLHVGLMPLHFNSDNLSQVLSSWIIMEFQLCSRNATETTKPMILTFATPSSIGAAGLDSLSLAVPPQALSNIYTNICDANPKNASNTLSQLPMVRAIQYFIEDSFAIDISTFPLVKIVTTYAALGSDGRFKPTEYGSSCPITLDFLRPTVRLAKVACAMQSATS